jgi:hypothetical protein
MTDRRVEAFFYGLFMDREILRASGVAPLNPRRAYVDDVALRKRTGRRRSGRSTARRRRPSATPCGTRHARRSANPDYAAPLQGALARLGFPPEYVASIA